MTQHFPWIAIGVALAFNACGDSSKQQSQSSSAGSDAAGHAGAGTASTHEENGGAPGEQSTFGGHASGKPAGVETGGAAVNAGADGMAPGAGDAGADNAAGGGKAASGPLALFIEAFCTLARTCCDSAGRDLTALRACERDVSETLEVSTLVDAGSVEVDAARLADCVAAYQHAAVTCTLDEIVTACRGVLRGTVVDGGPCRDVLECQRENGAKICLKNRDGAVDPDLGKCTPAPRGASGTACAGSCPVGHDCSTTSSYPDDTSPLSLCYEEDGLFCPLGDACAPIVGDGESCSWNEACGSDGFCLSTCSSRGHTGDVCQYNYGCVEGLTCEAGHCAALPAANDDVCTGHPLPLN
jgi:hypothetical protein